MNLQEAYQVLDIDENTTPEEIKKAYKKKCRENHPDLNKDDSQAEEKLKTINQAYDLISNPDSKYQEDFDTFDNFQQWASVFGNFGFNRYQPPQARDEKNIVVTLQYTIDVLLANPEGDLVYQTIEVCDKCLDNPGGVNKLTCGICKGTGHRSNVARQGNHTFVQQTSCGACQGKGFTYEKPCQAQCTDGFVSKEHKLKIKITAIKEN